MPWLLQARQSVPSTVILAVIPPKVPHPVDIVQMVVIVPICPLVLATLVGAIVTLATQGLDCSFRWNFCFL